MTTTRPGIVDCALYEGGRRRGGLVPLDTALRSAQDLDDGFVWIGLYEPSRAELDAVTEEFALHPLAVEDAVHAHQRAKLETYGEVTFVVLKTVRYVDPTEVIEVGEVMVFLGPRFVVVVRHGHTNPLADVRRRLEAQPELLRAGPAAVLYAIADHIVDDYGTAADGIDDDIDEVELEVFADPRTRAGNPTERLYKLMREALEFRRAVRPAAAPLGRLAGGEIALATEPTRPYFRDVEDHVLRVADRVDSYVELLTSALDANAAQIQHRENEDLRKITAWVAILAANTLIAGIYGMNFDHMPELGWRYGYAGAVGLMLLVSFALYRGFRRNHWI